MQAPEGTPNDPELSHIIALTAISQQPATLVIEADNDQCAALAIRFDLPKIYSLCAHVHFESDPIYLRGQLLADIDQICCATGETLRTHIDTPIAINFIAAPKDSNEIELEDDDCDVIFHDGQSIDVGEAIAQSLYLAIDPFARIENADEILSKAGVISEDMMQEKRRAEGPFGALSALKK